MLDKTYPPDIEINKKNRIVLLPSGRGMMLQRVRDSVVCFAGPTDHWGCVHPDTTRQYKPGKRQVRQWDKFLSQQ